MRSIAVVGASLAGLRAVEALRHEGFDGRITVIGAESRLPYDRPPLSKQVLAGEWDVDRIQLRDADRYDELDLDLRLGTQADRLDLAGSAVEIDDGTAIPYDGLVIATGIRQTRRGAESPGSRVAEVVRRCSWQAERGARHLIRRVRLPRTQSGRPDRVPVAPLERQRATAKRRGCCTIREMPL